MDIEANLREARQVARECEEKAFIFIRGGSAASVPAASFSFKCLWIFNNFKPGARYDFKQLGSQYEDFGNYHYGLYTKAMGINDTFAQVAAGVAQFFSGTYDWDFRGTYLDDPRDNEMIRKGQQYPKE